MWKVICSFTLKGNFSKGKDHGKGGGDCENVF